MSTPTPRRFRSSLIVISVAVAVASTVGVSAAQADPIPKTACTKIVKGVLDGAQTVAAGEVLCLRGATVNGAITVNATGGLKSRRSVVNGAITLADAKLFKFCRSATNAGAVSATGTTGTARIGGNRKCRTNIIDGAVHLGANFGKVILARSTVVGAVSVNDNAAIAGTPPKISANSIGGDLGCLNNVPAPVNLHRPNDVIGERTGQCASIRF